MTTRDHDAGPGDRTRRLTPRLGQVVDIQNCTLSVVSGPDTGHTVTIEGRSVKIGKGGECDLRLTDSSVSKVHALISPTPDGFVIEDLGSTNGTEVNGVPIKSAVLRPGCRIVLGTTTLEFNPGVRKLLAVPSAASRLEGLLGGSAAMRAVYGLIRQVASTEVSVVLQGETGTGKEVAARTIHALSARQAGPFVVFDCANVNRDLLGSELFGHQKGAFTGAVASHRGAFDRAHGGTLLLDEIGDLPLDLQARLLGVLQRREVQPLGAESAHPVDTRVLVATHRDLEAMSRSGGFREDLYFRLAVISVELPPLRDRREDIPELVEAFVHELAAPGAPAARVSSQTLDHLASLPWRGNVRELRNVVQRALVLSGGGEIQPSHCVTKSPAVFAPAVPPAHQGSIDPRAGEVAPVARAPTPVVGAAPATLEEAERQAIAGALQRHRGNKSRAARELGIALSTLRRKLRQYGMGDDSGDD
ncbi:MAG: sigma 54-interacting transcriptional regulator [Candidatus Riflebacteria bacterium]|nr:sigma 54-interacting transcriptional regulator [Candidatus Riflebacteria bacterium]